MIFENIFLDLWDPHGTIKVPIDQFQRWRISCQIKVTPARCADWTVLKHYYFPLVLDISIKIYAADSEWQMTR